jgi:ATP-dependent DNA helicase DinG
MGGSVLTLFTNRRDLRVLYDDVGARLERAGLRLVGQVPGESTKRIRDEFIGDERASLFATKSFWEGFDAKGDTLRCVVVVRLPFAHPGEPLLEELKERDPDRWWSDHYLPAAILELKQAAGRLIRSSTDEGCLVIADSRVVSGRPYGRRFLEALPVSTVRVATTGEVVAEIAEGFGRT